MELPPPERRQGQCFGVNHRVQRGRCVINRDLGVVEKVEDFAKVASATTFDVSRAEPLRFRRPAPIRTKPPPVPATTIALRLALRPDPANADDASVPTKSSTPSTPQPPTRSRMTSALASAERNGLGVAGSGDLCRNIVGEWQSNSTANFQRGCPLRTPWQVAANNDGVVSGRKASSWQHEWRDRQPARNRLPVQFLWA